MRINDSETIVVCDVDGTLIRPIVDFPEGFLRNDIVKIKNPYDEQEYTYEIHHEHISLLRQYKGRGFYIKVWSAGGVQHAVSVVKALGLNDGTVDEVETKPIKNMDDKKSSVHIIGSRVFIPRFGFEEEK